jgi:pyrophosphatase PpaX
MASRPSEQTRDTRAQSQRDVARLSSPRCWCCFLVRRAYVTGDMSSSGPRAVLFDLDGTLVDTIELLLSSMRHAFAEHSGPSPTTAEWVAGIGTPLATQLRVFAADEADLQRLTERYRSFQRAHHDRLTRCYDGVLDTVRQLSERGHPLAVVTSKANDIANRSIAHVGLASYFPIVVGVESTSRHKPDPEPVRFALGQLGVPASAAVFVGDSPHDIAAGNAAGVVTIAALWGAFSRTALERAAPDHMLDHIEGLPALLAAEASGVRG